VRTPSSMLPGKCQAQCHTSPSQNHNQGTQRQPAADADTMYNLLPFTSTDPRRKSSSSHMRVALYMPPHPVSTTDQQTQSDPVRSTNCLLLPATWLWPQNATSFQTPVPSTPIAQQQHHTHCLACATTRTPTPQHFLYTHARRTVHCNWADR
jgi:hypothetical protein